MLAGAPPDCARMTPARNRFGNVCDSETLEPSPIPKEVRVFNT